MVEGESISLRIKDGDYTVTRTLDGRYTVWSDRQPFPYRVTLDGQRGGVCDCPDFTLHRRKRRELCKHIRAALGLVG